jgi:hypothetical protein
MAKTAEKFGPVGAFLRRHFAALSSLLAAFYFLFRVIPVVATRWPGLTQPRYTQEHFNYLADLFSRSQYRQKEKPVIIPDETVFSYAAGAYIRGVDPILVNSEHTPLAKYLIGLGIVIFKNDSVMSLLFFGLFLMAMTGVSVMVIPNRKLALVPVFLFGSETLFINQLKYTPLLDLFHITFLLFAVAFYLWEYRHRSDFPFTAIFIGLTAASKTIIPALIMAPVIVGHLVFTGQAKRIRPFLLSSVLTVAVFLSTYVRTFLSGYSFWQFLGFQKWIIGYYTNLLSQPLAAWFLVFTGRMQTWWGDRSTVAAGDWQVTWPIITVGTVVAIAAVFKKRHIIPAAVVFLAMFTGSQLVFLSVGAAVGRYFFYLFPFGYILAFWLINQVLYEKRFRKE